MQFGFRSISFTPWLQPGVQQTGFDMVNRFNGKLHTSLTMRSVPPAVAGGSVRLHAYDSRKRLKRLSRDPKAC